MKLNKIINDDSLNFLKQIPDSIFDVVITDPPYGLTNKEHIIGEKTKAQGGFMGVKWDKDIPSIKLWREVLRVMKSGAFAFIMTTARQDSLGTLLFNLQQAGFRINFPSIYWTYSSNFPKAYNVSKGIDKKLGVKRKIINSYERAGRKSGIMGEKVKITRNITVPSSLEAKLMDGWFTFNPKIATEIIVVAQKPLKYKSNVEQALNYAKNILEKRIQ